MGSSLVLPGQATIPKMFGEAMVLFTAGDRVEAVVDGAPVGPRGRLYVVEPNKPTKVPYEAGRFILEHLGYTGVVRVNETETDTGVSYDIESAKAESLTKLEAEDKAAFKRYISDAVEDFVKRNKPVPQPDERILKIIQRRGYDLKQFGIVPIGWATPEDDKVVAMQSENAELKKSLEALQSQMAAFIAGQQAGQQSGGSESKKKG
jgi:hypothetical protein